MSDDVSVIYVGPHENDPETGFAVEVPLPDSDLAVFCKKGEPVDVPAELAHGVTVDGVQVTSGLLDQSDAWQPAAKHKPRAQREEA